MSIDFKALVVYAVLPIYIKKVMKNFRLSNTFIITSILATITSLAVSQPSLTEEISQQETLTLTGTIRDFKAYRLADRTINEGGHQDFQRYVGIDENYDTIEEFGAIAGDTLDAEGKPTYKPGNGSTTTTTNEANFSQWYRDVPGVNQSMSYGIDLRDEDGDGVYTYAKDLNQAESFFPIDNMLWGNEGYEHNYHFTFELPTQFTYIPGTESEPRIFTFKGDDDVFVFINGQKVIDIGGIHVQKEQSVNVDNLGLTPGNTYDLKLFFAERNVTQSNFRIDTNIVLEELAPVAQLYAD